MVYTCTCTLMELFPSFLSYVITSTLQRRFGICLASKTSSLYQLKVPAGHQGNLGVGIQLTSLRYVRFVISYLLLVPDIFIPCLSGVVLFVFLSLISFTSCFTTCTTYLSFSQRFLKSRFLMTDNCQLGQRSTVLFISSWS